MHLIATTCSFVACQQSDAVNEASRTYLLRRGPGGTVNCAKPTLAQECKVCVIVLKGWAERVFCHSRSTQGEPERMQVGGNRTWLQHPAVEGVARADGLVKGDIAPS